MKKHFTTLQIGPKNTGKTAYCKKRIHSLSSTGRCLILDVRSEYGEYPILIDEEFLTNNQPGIFRINLSGISLEKLQEKYIEASLKFESGLLICESFNMVCSDRDFKIIQLFESGLCTNRSRKLDIVANMKLSQALRSKVVNNSDYLIVRGYTDNLKKFKRLMLPNNYKLINKAYKLLATNINRGVILNFEKGKVELEPIQGSK